MVCLAQGSLTLILLFLLVCDEFAWSLFEKSQSVGQHLKALRSRQIAFDFMNSQPGGRKKGCLKTSPGVNLLFPG